MKIVTHAWNRTRIFFFQYNNTNHGAVVLHILKEGRDAKVITR